MSWWLIGLIVVLILIIIALSAYKMVLKNSLHPSMGVMETSVLPGGFYLCPWDSTVLEERGRAACVSSQYMRRIAEIKASQKLNARGNTSPN
jgi:hypothetical protein